MKKIEDFPLAPCPACGVEVTTAYDFSIDVYPYTGEKAINRWHGACGWVKVNDKETNDERT